MTVWTWCLCDLLTPPCDPLTFSVCDPLWSVDTSLWSSYLLCVWSSVICWHLPMILLPYLYMILYDPLTFSVYDPVWSADTSLWSSYLLCIWSSMICWHLPMILLPSLYVILYDLLTPPYDPLTFSVCDPLWFADTSLWSSYLLCMWSSATTITWSVLVPPTGLCDILGHVIPQVSGKCMCTMYDAASSW